MARRDAAIDKNVIEEKEPNNYPNNAQRLPRGKGAKGIIGEPFGPNGELGDRDFYKFVVPKGAHKWNLWARLTGVAGLRIVLEIREGGSYEQLVVATSPRVGRGVTLTNLALTSGEYYFRVRERWTGKKRHYNLKSPYVLRWRLEELKKGDEREPNDEVYQAIEFNVNGKVSGYLGHVGDVDFYKVYLKDIGDETRLHVSLSRLKGVTFEATLYDGLMKRLLVRTGKRGRSLVFRNLKLPRPKQFFFIKVEAKKGFNPREGYVLGVGRDAVGKDGVEREPNDVFNMAMFLQKERGKLYGILESKRDKDFYRLNTTRSKTLKLSVKPEEDMDLKVKLFDRRGRYQLTANAGRKGFAEVLPNVRVRPGDFYIQVANATKKDASTGRYNLQWRLMRIEKGDEAEPNNKMNQATRLFTRVSARGYIYPPGDRDFYRFRLSGRRASTGRVSITVQGIPKVRLKLSLLDSVKNVLKESSRRSFAGVRKVEVNLHVRKWYYLLVEDSDGRRSNPTDSYELEVVRKW